MKPLRVALAGIDGSGKSTLAGLLRRDAGYLVLSGMRSHPTLDAPLSELSMTLTSASADADRYGDRRLKLLLHYLQLCMFGPIERFFLDAHSPEVLLADRHPVIDSAVYLPVLRRRITNCSPPADISVIDPTALALITAWAEAQARRLGRTFDSGELEAELLKLGGVDDAGLLQQLPHWLNCDLPDVVLQIVLPPELAANRLTVRGGNREPHENASMLALVDARYRDLAPQLDHLPVYRLDVADRSPELVARLAHEAIDDARGRLC